LVWGGVALAVVMLSFIFEPMLLLPGMIMGLLVAILGLLGLRKPRRNGMALAGSLLGLLACLMPCCLILPELGYMGRGRVDRVRRIGTISDIKDLTTALERFKSDNGRYPTSAEGLEALLSEPAALAGRWKGPYMDRVPTDKWGVDYVYASPGTPGPASFDLHSMGSDHVDGTDDDIDGSTK